MSATDDTLTTQSVVHRKLTIMTYRPHLLLQWGGRMADSQEEWSNSLRLAANTEDANALHSIAVDQVDEIAGEVATYVADGQGPYGSVAHLDYVKLNPIGPDGRYSSPNDTVAYTGGALTDVTGQGPLGPFQLSAVMTLTTPAARGRGHIGRFYVPVKGGLSFDLMGRVSQSVVDQWALSTATFLNAVNDNPGFDTAAVHAAVFSKLGNPGPYWDVTGVKVGRVMDTQRRRRESLSEEYGTNYAVTGQG